MNKIKIGIDVRILKTHPKRGSSRHLVSVIKNIKKNKVILFANEFINLSDFDLGGYCLKIGGVKNYVIWEQVFLPITLLKNKVTHLYSPNHTSPIFAPCEKIIAVYDLIFIDYLSIRNIFEKGFLGSLNRFLTSSISIIFGSRIITISQFTKKKIFNKFKINEQMITFITCPLLLNSSQDLLHDSNRYRVLMVTGSMQHKNLANGINSFLKSKCAKKYKLTIIGVNPDEINKENYSREIDWKFNISRDELIKIYTESVILLFPSVIEGFGIPLLEAMEFGLKIVCSGNSVFPEICEDSAIYFDPYSVADMTEKINICDEGIIDSKKYNVILSKYSDDVIKNQVNNFLSALQR